jgi:hypothetical protein
VVEIPAKDASREWITLTSEKSPEKAKRLRNELERLNVREIIEEAITLGRLYAGETWGAFFQFQTNG